MTSPPTAFVFDAYGTLFDVQPMAAAAEAEAPGHGAALAKLWRAKQLEYSWLAGLRGDPADFASVTAAALDYTIASLVLPVSTDARERLLAGWLTLPPYADAAATLARLAPHPRWILSNGTRAMLAPLVAGSEIAGAIDGVLSVEEAGVFKPSPRVYALASDRLAIPARSIGFVSANGWDAAGAKAFGFTTFWINRASLPVERHGPPPDHVVGTLSEILKIVAP